MSNISHIIPVDERYQESTIEALERWLEKAKSGEVVSFIGVFELKGGGYSTVGPGCPDRHRQAGLLLELAVQRVIED